MHQYHWNSWTSGKSDVKDNSLGLQRQETQTTKQKILFDSIYGSVHNGDVIVESDSNYFSEVDSNHKGDLNNAEFTRNIEPPQFSNSSEMIDSGSEDD